MLNDSDEQLISTYLAGEEKSLELLIERHLKPIYSFIYRYIGNATDAEDIIQEVFVKMWRHLKKFDQNKSFKAWIFSIAKNSALDFLKKRKTLPFSEFSAEDGNDSITDTLIDPSPLPQEILERKDLNYALATAINKLSPKYRAVLFLHHHNNFSFREISASVGESLNTVKSRYRRALILLKKLLA